MSIDIVRGELERLLSLDEMKSLSAELLGLDPADVGGTVSKASFAKALVDRCAETGAIDALVVALVATRDDVDAKVQGLLKTGITRPEELKAGETIGPFTISKKLGEGPRGIVYLAKRDGIDRVLKVIRRSAAADARGLQRFLTHVRLAARVGHENLPSGLEAGIVSGRAYTSYAPVEGQPLAARIARTGPLHMNEARNLLRGVLAALGALHDAKLSHGAVRLENVIVARGADGTPRSVLVDVGGDRLVGSLVENGYGGSPWGSTNAIKTSAPEQLRGRPGDARSDLFGFGAVLFEVLAGKPLFQGENAFDAAIARLTAAAPTPSSVAPRGWVSAELDKLAAQLLDRSPDARPANIAAVKDAIELAGKAATAKEKITDEDLTAKIDALVADPTDQAAAMALEAAVDYGAEATTVAEAFVRAAEAVPEGESEGEKIRAAESKKQILFRAARVHQGAKDLERAEGVFAQLYAIDPDDDVVQVSLEDVRRELGKYDELVEMLLERGEKSESHSVRARALHTIGQLYCKELDDREQGVFAFAQALSQDVLNEEYAADLERAAGQDMNLWAESLQILSQVTSHPTMPAEPRIALFSLLGRWYSDKVARPDLGLPCFQAVLQLDPSNDGALEGITNVYRRAQQWEELSQVLLSRADRGATADLARNLRVEAAEVLATKLSDPARARAIYEAVFTEDPSNARVVDALASIYQRLEDWSGLAKVLERRIEALRGEERLDAMCKAAELFEDQLNDLGEATRRYEAVLALEPRQLLALKGLDRIHNRTGNYRSLLENLDKQLAISATPRQKINLLERVAGIYEEEFLDHAKAAEALETLLTLDATHESALTALGRHYRALDRWEDVNSIYERHLKIVTDDKRRLDLLVGMGRVLLEQVRSPERARRAYEQVLELDPSHAGALEALASVRAATGDSSAALSAIESLAAKATTPEAKADLWLRAAKMLDDAGDRDGAIERYKASLEANPGSAAASIALRQAYIARGDATSAVELMTRQIEAAEGNLAKARLYADMAKVLREKLGNAERAKEAATKAVDLDPTSLVGLMVTGDLAFDAGHYLEAVKAYEPLAGRAEALPKQEGVQLLIRYVDALAKSGSTEKAKDAIPTLLALAPDDPGALARAGKVRLDAGEASEAVSLFEGVLSRFSDQLGTAQRAEALLNLGLAKLGAGDVEGAVSPLKEAADLAPDSPAPIDALCKLYEAKKQWDEVIRIKTMRLDIVTGEERSNLLLDVGEILATHLNDRTRAAKSFVAALEERPDDRKILSKLMQLYSEDKDWTKLVEVVLKLADMVEEKKQKAKYMLTAAIVCARQLQDSDKAAQYFARVLELDPSVDKARTELMMLREQKGDHQGVETLLRMELERHTDASDAAKMVTTLEKLAALYKDKLGSMGEAVEALEAAQALDAENHDREELLAGLYAGDPAQYLDKAIASQGALLRRNPHKPEPYRALRKLYTESKRADAAWCLCQALSAMNCAEPDEQRFFQRMRAEGPAAAQDRFSNDDWAKLIMHEDADPLVTAIFATIEPAVLRRNGQALDALGYSVAYQLDLARHPYPMSQTLYYAAGVLGLEPPPTFQNQNDQGGVSFLHAHTPGIVLGAAALASDIPTQAAAFIAARHLAYYRPGLYLRHLVPTGTGLRAWLFAAIKLITPAFPVAKELEGPVKDNMALIEPVIVGPARDQLASAVTKLLQSGAIDLKRWTAAVDLSADRAGFIIANDLELASEMVRNSDEASAGIGTKDRLKALNLYSVSEAYFAARRRLGINIDS